MGACALTNVAVAPPGGANLGTPRRGAREPPPPLLSEEGAVAIQRLEPREELEEEFVVGHDVFAPDGLADRVHAERGYAHVDSPHPRLGGNDRADGAAAWAVVAHYKLLAPHVCPPRELPHDETRGGGRCVPLVAVGLDDCALVEEGRVVSLVLGGVVGVDGVRDIGADQEAVADADPQGVLVAPKGLAQPSNHVLHQGAPRPVRRVAPDLLVVKERDDRRLAVPREPPPTSVVGKGLDGRVAVNLVVQPRR
mmetsp:Transcript_24679/g.62500  ORF Transcript_24679/g.62500 Transcript_24679/m.62500 type:complete len:252 (-) Transcript_24679:818-1573(-)